MPSRAWLSSVSSESRERRLLRSHLKCEGGGRSTGGFPLWVGTLLFCRVHAAAPVHLRVLQQKVCVHPKFAAAALPGQGPPAKCEDVLRLNRKCVQSPWMLCVTVEHSFVRLHGVCSSGDRARDCVGCYGASAGGDHRWVPCVPVAAIPSTAFTFGFFIC